MLALVEIQYKSRSYFKTWRISVKEMKVFREETLTYSHLFTSFIFSELDINECRVDGLALHHANYSHNCDDDANCTNTNGSFYCTCLDGYSGDGVMCTGREYC